jgi:hypothetical protein
MSEECADLLSIRPIRHGIDRVLRVDSARLATIAAGRAFDVLRLLARIRRGVVSEAPMAKRKSTRAGLFTGYRPLPGSFDEYADARGVVRPEAARVVGLLEGLGREEVRARRKLADATFLKSGVTFSVYSDERGSERIFPFDLIPRIISGSAWQRVSLGLEQRIRALNAFLADVYGPQRPAACTW